MIVRHLLHVEIAIRLSISSTQKQGSVVADWLMSILNQAEIEEV